MGSKHKKTLEAIFLNPIHGNIVWGDIEKMLIHYGAKITEGGGSKIGIKLNDVRAYFHRPHPQKETDKGAVKSMRRFLEEAGLKP